LFRPPLCQTFENIEPLGEIVENIDPLIEGERGLLKPPEYDLGGYMNV
jgi:hypothetical protein